MNVHVAAKSPSKPKRPDLEAELNNFALSKESQPLFDAANAHIYENLAPIIEEGPHDRKEHAS